MKNFLVMLLILLVVAIASTANAADKKHPLDWDEKELVQYTSMVVGKYLNENTFEDSNEVRMKVTTHIVSALQILKNEGVIYCFDVDSPYVNIIDNNVIVIVTILKEVSDEEGTQIKFTLHDKNVIKKKVVKV